MKPVGGSGHVSDSVPEEDNNEYTAKEKEAQEDVSKLKKIRTKKSTNSSAADGYYPKPISDSFCMKCFAEIPQLSEMEYEGAYAEKLKLIKESEIAHMEALLKHISIFLALIEEKMKSLRADQF
ncbi:hypothetical protein JCGZ_10781 [Jatropha curcas]|uniref:Uncharacterized protein n=1 Tax=Jatropha curcas TaxID=180498 RepID=A0A067LR22_JATCU|nr:hypothetical protein JCGZ_10781 [Jatropha curcas]